MGIVEFYEGKSILITGASGFIGKVLVEKLLYSCPELDTIFILIRDKKISVPQRIQSLIDKPIFTRLKEDNSSAIEKIVPIKGDLTLKNLGLSNDDEKLLIEKVSIVFHLAASIRFHDAFEETFDINVGGTERILNLCKRMKVIEKFVYVSTAYSNADRTVIHEEFYPMSVSLNEVKKLIINGISDSQIKKLLNGKPNTYTLTKALAEEVVKLNHDQVPSVIIRPSIVASSINEPIPGWIDNWAGASGLIATYIKGVNNIVFAKPAHILDLIPVDYVVNLIIVAATLENKNKDHVPVFHSCTSKSNPLTLGMLSNILLEYFFDSNSTDNLGTENLIFTMSKSKVQVITFLKQTVPAHMGDLLRHLKGKNKKYIKLLNKVLFIRKMLDPFTSNSWIISADKTKDLEQSLSESERKIFPFNAEDIDWSEYLSIYMDGMKKYLLK